MAETTGTTPTTPLIEMITGYMPPQIIYVAARLGLADLLAGGPRTAEELAAAAGAQPATLHRLLRALACLGAVEETEPGRFALTETGRPLRADVPDSIRALALLFCAPEIWHSWAELLDAVRTGEPPFARVNGTGFFDFFARDEELYANFNTAMADGTRAVVPLLAEACDFTRFRTVVDVGGNDGTLVAGLLAAVPGLRGVLFDRPEGAVRAAKTLAAAGVADRCEVVTGDFFDAVPEVPGGGEAYLLKNVLHDWDDGRVAVILRNCRRAMSPDATLLVVESVMDPTVTPGSPNGAKAVVMSDVSMLVSHGGRERTEAEYRALLASAGLEVTAVGEPFSPLHYRVLEARPSTTEQTGDDAGRQEKGGRP